MVCELRAWAINQRGKTRSVTYSTDRKNEISKRQRCIYSLVVWLLPGRGGTLYNGLTRKGYLFEDGRTFTKGKGKLAFRYLKGPFKYISNRPNENRLSVSIVGI